MVTAAYHAMMVEAFNNFLQVIYAKHQGAKNVITQSKIMKPEIGFGCFYAARLSVGLELNADIPSFCPLVTL